MTEATLTSLAPQAVLINGQMVPVKGTASQAVQRSFSLDVPASFGYYIELTSLVGIPFVTQDVLWSKDNDEVAVSIMLVSDGMLRYFVSRHKPIMNTLKAHFLDTQSYDGLYAEHGLTPRAVQLQDETKGVNGYGVSWRFATTVPNDKWIREVIHLEEARRALSAKRADGGIVDTITASDIETVNPDDLFQS